MSDRSEIFETPSPVKLRVEVPAGRVFVTAEATEQTHIELTALSSAARKWVADAEISKNGEEIVVFIRQPSIFSWGFNRGVDMNIHVPLESWAALTTGSGHIDTAGKLGKVRATSGSGKIRLDDCGEVYARTGSGEITVRLCAGSVDAKTGSGHVTVGKVGADARIETASGGAEIDEVGGNARIQCASGHIEVGQSGDTLDAHAASGSIRVRRTDHGRVRARTYSGSVKVGVANGTAALLDVSTMSGRVDSELRPSDVPGAEEKRVELILSTMSGNVTVARV
ncbi:MAG: DUF4097 family beta strand repeat protein [Alphaproteobacteria bacterium]|nr:DUF4097 family beta strand repeat protein [Alphaproteobacteria bacterium]MBL7096659.1 DUF4097 family beta strand repeat protein [Alphaproteobacteria bacterium]